LPVLPGVARDDSEPDATYLADKIAGLRPFDDDEGKMNRSVRDVGGSVLAVAQFTLYGGVRRGNRPSFDAAALPEKAPPTLRILRRTNSRCRPSLENWPLRGNDEGGVSWRTKAQSPCWIHTRLSEPSLLETNGA
jgi:D-tyrosyl-tRNA(Tyr) deacylase